MIHLHRLLKLIDTYCHVDPLKANDPVVLVRFESCVSQESWSTPSRDCRKLNTDVSWCFEKKSDDLKWVVHDSQSFPICVGLKNFDKGWLINALEEETIQVDLASLFHLRRESC